MFVFGEPDIRIHFNKQINELNRDVDEVVSTLCNNYILKLLDIVPSTIKIIIRYILITMNFQNPAFNEFE